MKTRWLGIVSIITLLFTTTWLALFISDLASVGPNESFEELVARLSQLEPKFYLIYISVGLLTLVVPFQMVGLYLFSKPHLPGWLALAGLMFVPVYCVLNLFAYLSQISAVPHLLALYQAPAYQQIAEILLRLLLQQWPASLVAFFNNLAYALLGIPSIIYGAALVKQGQALKVAGILLALNGVACILGIIGIGLRNDLLAWGSAIGGGLYFLALFPMSWGFLSRKE